MTSQQHTADGPTPHRPQATSSLAPMAARTESWAALPQTVELSLHSDSAFAAQLRDARVPLVRRQALATEVSRLKGNHHVQRVLTINSSQLSSAQSATPIAEDAPQAPGEPIETAGIAPPRIESSDERHHTRDGEGTATARLQRDAPPAAAPSAAAIWNAPFELGPIADRGASRTALNIVISNLNGLKSSLDEAGVASLDGSVKTLESERDSLIGNDPLTATEARDLNVMGRLAEQIYNARLESIKAAVRAFVAMIKLPDTSEADASLADALHASFVNAEGEDKVGPIKSAISTLKEYTDHCKKVAGWGEKAANAVEKVKTAESLKAFQEGVGKVSTLIGHVKDVLSAADHFATLAGFQKEKAGGMQQSISQFRAGMELASTAMTLFKSVPIIGQYWSKFIIPLTEACLKGLEKLTSMAEKIGLESVLDALPGPNGAPIIPRLQVQFFPGGQPILDFMYQLVNRGAPPITTTVEQYFIKFRKQFNAGQINDDLEVKSTSKWYNPLSWGDAEKAPDLMDWLQRNKDTVWSQLYGSLPHNLKR